MSAVTASNQPSQTNRSASGARRTSMKYRITNGTLTAAMGMIAIVATSGVTEFFESNQVDAQVASINAAHTILTGLRTCSIVTSPDTGAGTGGSRSGRPLARRSRRLRED